MSELGKILEIHRIKNELITFIIDFILNFEEDGEVLSEYSNQILNLLKTLKQNDILSFIGLEA